MSEQMPRGAEWKDGKKIDELIRQSPPRRTLHDLTSEEKTQLKADMKRIWLTPRGITGIALLLATTLLIGMYVLRYFF